MKKQRNRLWAIVWTVAALAGCSAPVQKAAVQTGRTERTEQAEAYVEAAHSLLKEADGFTAQVDVEVSVQGEESVVQSVVSMQKEPLEMQVESKKIYADAEQETELFWEEDAEAVNLYTNYDGHWTEMTLTEEAAMQTLQIYNTLYHLESIFDIAQDWTVTKADAVIRSL